MAGDQVFTAEAPQRSGCGRMLFFGAGCGCLLFLMLCCGFFGIAGYTVSRFASVDPVEVRDVRQSIADIQVPEEFTPLQSFDFTIPVIDRRMISWVIYEGRDDMGMLVLAEFGADMDVDVDTAVDELERSLAEQGRHAKQVEINEDETEKQEFVIRGQPAEFIFAKGRAKDSDDDREYWFVTGTFSGRQGQAVLLLIVDAEEFPRERIVELIESIR